MFADEDKDESGISNTAVDVVEEETEKRDSKEVRNEKKKSATKSNDNNMIAMLQKQVKQLQVMLLQKSMAVSDNANDIDGKKQEEMDELKKKISSDGKKKKLKSGYLIHRPEYVEEARKRKELAKKKRA